MLASWHSGRIDVLHNNVGIVEVGGPVETSDESLGQGQRRNPEEHVFDANSILPGMMNTPMVHAAEGIAAYGGSAEERSCSHVEELTDDSAVKSPLLCFLRPHITVSREFLRVGGHEHRKKRSTSHLEDRHELPGP